VAQQVAHRVIGTDVPRKEDPELVTGRGRYTEDLTVPGMLWMKLVRSPFAHARINGVDLSKAKTMPGVVAAFSGWYLLLPGASAICFVLIRHHSGDVTRTSRGWMPTRSSSRRP